MKPELELRSEEVREIIGKAPTWTIRWGITVICIVIIMILVAAWFIKYPDIMRGDIMLTTANPPIKIVVRTSGKLQHLFIKENQLVTSGEYLAEIENPSSRENIDYLAEVVSKFDQFFHDPEHFKITLQAKNFIAGELQTEYNTLITAYHDFQIIKHKTYYPEKIRTLHTQIENYERMTLVIANQNDAISHELTNTEERHKVDKMLFADSLISKFELKGSENSYLQKKQLYENVKKLEIDNVITLTENKKVLLDFEHEYEEKLRSQILLIRTTLNNIKNLINRWEQNYILISPINGEASFFKNWSENQYLSQGDELFAIIPAKQELIGVVFLSGKGLGKVNIGQKVRIRLHHYPSDQYGQVNGIVNSVAKVGDDDKYKIVITLPKGLFSTYKKQLEFKPEMTGLAEIVTKDMSILERIFDRLSNLIKNRI